MSLLHSPSKIVSRLAIEAGFGTAPSLNLDWPLSYNKQPANPSNFMTLYDTTGVADGRNMKDGVKVVHPGLLLRVRATTADIGYAKASEMAGFFDDVRRNEVEIDGRNYRVDNLSRVGDIISLGEEPGTTRQVYTLNVLVTITDITL